MTVTGAGVVLDYRLDRWGLYQTFRLSSAGRPMRYFLVPAIGGLVFLTSAMDGNPLKGALWALGVVLLYWTAKRAMILLNVYGSGNHTLLVPQKITLYADRMVVSSEHSREEFGRPTPGSARFSREAIVLRSENMQRLVLVRRGFARQEDFDILKEWMEGED